MDKALSYSFDTMVKPKMFKEITGKINLKIILVIMVGLLVAFLGYYLRLNKFYYFPPVNDTADEYKYAFNGISLINNKVPESWSWYDDYGKFPVKNFRGSNFRMVKPYFDDPPLFGLIMGSYAISKGMDSYEKVDAGALRWPMLKLGALNIFLLFLLIYLSSGFFEALVGSLLYATIPTIVLSSRLPLAENMITTLCLFSLLLTRYYIKKDNRIVLLLLSLLSASAILVKQTGVFLPAAVVLLLVKEKRLKGAAWVAFAAILLGGAWLLYGYYYDWSLFVRIQMLATGREIRLPAMIIYLFDTFRITEKMMSTDGIIIWGWISVIIISFLKDVKGRLKVQKNFLMIPLWTYLVLFAVMSGHLKGWYRIPFYPFLCWSMAIVFLEMFKTPHFLSVFFFVTLPFFASFIGGTGENYWNASQAKIYQLIFPSVMLIFFINYLKKNIYLEKTIKTLLIIFLVFLIIYNIRTNLLFIDQFWY